MSLRPAFLGVMVCLLGGLAAKARTGLLDPGFARFSFERWRGEADVSQISWKIEIPAARLNEHQRMQTRVTVTVPARELEGLSSGKNLFLLVQFTDAVGRLYQAHRALLLTSAGRGGDLIYSVEVFLIPGEYRVEAAITDRAGEEYGFVRQALRVAELKHDPLPEIWEGAPAVEFPTATETPDSWYLPELGATDNLRVKAPRPVRFELVANLTTSSDLYAPRHSRVGLETLVPTLKVLSQVEINGARPEIAAIDLARQQVTFEQAADQKLDWERLKLALKASNPRTVDVSTLENRKLLKEYFVGELTRRFEEHADGEAGDAQRVFIILSAAMIFEPGEHGGAIQLAEDCNCRIFYFRFAPPPIPPTRGAATSIPTAAVAREIPSPDQLEGTLNPLKPRLFDVHSSEEFRKALAAMLTDISRL